MSGVGSTEPPKSGGAGSAGAGADMDPELQRKNTMLGWALLALMIVLFAGTVGVALIYLAVD